MITELLTVLFFLLSAYLFKRVHLSYRATKDDVYIAQFNPSNFEDIKRYIRCTGLNKLKVNIYLDFTLNNIRGTKNLHKIHKKELNVYQKVLTCLMEGLGNTEIPIGIFGFGEIETQDTEVFSVTSYQHCVTPSDAVQFYNATINGLEMSGPRSFIPAIRHATDQSRLSGQHLVFIITSGLPEDVQQNFKQVIDSSWSDVLVVFIGVGSGPWNGITTLTRYSNEKKFSNASYLLQNMYSDDIDFLRNIVLTTKGLHDNLLEDVKTVSESSQFKND